MKAPGRHVTVIGGAKESENTPDTRKAESSYLDTLYYGLARNPAVTKTN